LIAWSDWIAFARTGNPNTPELPEWPPYSETERATMVFDLEPVVANDPKEEIRLLMPPLP
jgi:para-nitrobenzyl esterase